MSTLFVLFKQYCYYLLAYVTLNKYTYPLYIYIIEEEGHNSDPTANRLILRSEAIRLKEVVRQWHNILLHNILTLHELFTLLIFEHKEIINSGAYTGTGDPQNKGNSFGSSRLEYRISDVSDSLYDLHSHAMLFDAKIDHIFAPTDTSNIATTNNTNTNSTINTDIMSTPPVIHSASNIVDSYRHILNASVGMSKEGMKYEPAVYVAVIKMLRNAWRSASKRAMIIQTAGYTASDHAITDVLNDTRRDISSPPRYSTAEAVGSTDYSHNLYSLDQPHFSPPSRNTRDRNSYFGIVTPHSHTSLATLTPDASEYTSTQEYTPFSALSQGSPFRMYNTYETSSPRLLSADMFVSDDHSFEEEEGS